MMDKKRQLIEELLEHLNGSQGDDLMDLVKSKKPTIGIEALKVDTAPKEDFDAKADQAIADVGKPDESSALPQEGEEASGDQDQEMTDEELSDLLKEYLKK